MKAYLVLKVETAIAFDIDGESRDIPLTFQDGSLGACPIFDTRENAEKAYDPEEYPIVEVR